MTRTVCSSPARIKCLYLSKHDLFHVLFTAMAAGRL